MANLSHKKFSEWEQAHVEMQPYQTKWEWHHNTFHTILTSCAPSKKAHQKTPFTESYPNLKTSKKVFFVTIICRYTWLYTTIASVGRAVVVDCKYEQIVIHEQQEHAKRVITQIFEEWKQECKEDLYFRKLCVTEK